MTLSFIGSLFAEAAAHRDESSPAGTEATSPEGVDWRDGDESLRCTRRLRHRRA
jgi:hypothetical protein